MTNSVSKILGTNIKKIRLSRNMTQSALAEALNIDVKSLSLVETGKGFVSAKTLDKITTILNVPPSDLFAENSTADTSRIYSEIISNLELIKNSYNKLSTVNLFVKGLI